MLLASIHSEWGTSGTSTSLTEQQRARLKRLTGCVCPCHVLEHGRLSLSHKCNKAVVYTYLQLVLVLWYRHIQYLTSIVPNSGTRTNTQYCNTGTSVCASQSWTLHYGAKARGWPDVEFPAEQELKISSAALLVVEIRRWHNFVSWCSSTINRSSDSFMLTIHHQCVMISILFSGLMYRKEVIS